MKNGLHDMQAMSGNGCKASPMIIIEAHLIMRLLGSLAIVLRAVAWWLVEQHA